MNLGKALVDVATAPVRIGLVVAEMGLGVASETLDVVQRGLDDGGMSANGSSFARLLGLEEAVDRANRLAHLWTTTRRWAGPWRRTARSTACSSPADS